MDIENILIDIRKIVCNIKVILSDEDSFRNRVKEIAKQNELLFTFSSVDKSFKDYSQLERIVTDSSLDSYPNIMRIRKILYNSYYVMNKRISLADAPDEYRFLCEDVQELSALLSQNSDVLTVDSFYKDYSEKCNKIEGIIQGCVKKVNALIGINSRPKFYIMLPRYYQMASGRNGRELTEEFESFCKSKGFLVKVGSTTAYLSAISEEDKYLDKWYREVKSLKSPYFYTFHDWQDEFLPFFEIDTSMTLVEFKEEYSGKTEDELLALGVLLDKHISATTVICERLVNKAKSFSDRKQSCIDEFRNIWLKNKDRPKTLLVKGEFSHLKITPRFENIVYIEGETSVYSELEGCSCHLNYKGNVVIHISDSGKSFDVWDDNLDVESEYDGWDYDEMMSNILEDLKDNFTFEYI